MRKTRTLPAQKQRSAALYMRVSREDGEAGPSASIETQRKILRNYAQDNGFVVFREYIDDGFTGTNFERPAFERLKADVLEGLVGVVLTKDFSRLGRNTGQVMTVLDDFFTRNGVRYISITEGIDTAMSERTDILAPMLGFANELYAGDISRKINASFAAKMRAGEFIGAFAPYGYQKDPENKNHLLPDTDAANVVVHIFSLAKEGYSPKEISDFLNQEGVLTPLDYRLQKKQQKEEEPFAKWSAAAVGRILRNEVYLGHTLQGKTHKVSFKSTYTANLPRDEWIFVPDTHKALISMDTWNAVRKKMRSRNRRRKAGFSNLFSGLARCSDCGRSMSTAGTHKKGARYNLACGGYKQFGPGACLPHTIDYDVLLSLVLEAIRQMVPDFNEIETLDGDILFKLIDRIYVHQGKYEGKTKKQKIDIYFTFHTETKEFEIIK